MVLRTFYKQIWPSLSFLNIKIILQPAYSITFSNRIFIYNNFILLLYMIYYIITKLITSRFLWIWNDFVFAKLVLKYCKNKIINLVAYQKEAKDYL